MTRPLTYRSRSLLTAAVMAALLAAAFPAPTAAAVTAAAATATARAPAKKKGKPRRRPRTVFYLPRPTGDLHQDLDELFSQKLGRLG
ncbi:hypothetical protein EG831_05395, partial [bacterium]|nr:hypothetical protein [bacterium]